MNQRHLKNDLENSGIVESVIYHDNRYFVIREEIECDSDLFERTYEEFKNQSTRELAKKLLSLYKGEYLADFEALWVAEKRIRYREIYEKAKVYLSVV